MENYSEHWLPLPSMGSASALCWEDSGSCWALCHHHTATKQSWDCTFHSLGQSQLQKPTFTISLKPPAHVSAAGSSFEALMAPQAA